MVICVSKTAWAVSSENIAMLTRNADFVESVFTDQWFSFCFDYAETVNFVS
jgi:hypothetical protein